MVHIWSTLLCGSALSAVGSAAPGSKEDKSTKRGPIDHCSSSYLSNGISIPNEAKVLDLLANSVTNYAVPGSSEIVDFCNVTVTYTHPGWNDTIHTTVYLPLSNWNGRFQGVGGGGWAASSGVSSLLSPVANNYSAGTTDAGHDLNSLSSASWWQTANGMRNFPLLTDFASVALNDLAVIGKQLSNKYYGYGPKYSYWNGCSTGGRQGLMMAQKYPTAYNGIYAACPAINWDVFQIAQYWGQFIMNQLDYHPPSCVFDAITAAAVEACDALDGVVDGVISDLSSCHFDPMSVVNQRVNCSGNLVTITEQAAEIAQRTWQGPRTADGSFLWWGINPGAAFEGLTDTTCTSLSNCTGTPFGITSDWMTRWVLDDENFDLTKISLGEFVNIFNSARAQYEALIGTNNPDLSAFRKSGGKMITWHGLADQLIYPGSTENYYQNVERLDPTVRGFYRFFIAPGVGHCGGGAGETPIDPLDAVVNWVEKGVEPDTLPAVSTDGTRYRNLCQYPLVSVYQGGDNSEASSFVCKSHF